MRFEKHFYNPDRSEEFNLALVIDDLAYYINETESDENSSTMIISSAKEIVGSSYVATNDYFEQMTKLAEHPEEMEFLEYISDACKNSVQEVRKEIFEE